MDETTVRGAALAGIIKWKWWLGLAVGMLFFAELAGATEPAQILKESVQVSMRDGTSLQTNVFQHPGPIEPLPVLLLRTRYDRNTFDREARVMAAGGYVTVTQDHRGFYGSAGEKLEIWQEGPDGIDTIDWIRAQTWCNGKVGMWGALNTGFSQWIALIDGASLDAIAPTASWILREEKIDFSRLDVPVQHVVGQYDFLCRGSVQMFQNMQRHAGSTHARQNQQLILGPWSHSTGQPRVEDVDFGKLAAMQPSYSGRPRENLWWFDRFLKGRNDQDPYPAVRYFSMGENIWHTATTWPPAETQPTEFFFHSGGNANTRVGDGRLRSAPPPGEQPADTFISDAADPVPTAPGREEPLVGRFGPFDQRRAQDRGDVLVYQTPPLTAAVTFAGPIQAELFIEQDQPGGNWIVKLVDIHPDGFTHPLATGAWHLHPNESRVPARALQADVISRLEIDLGHAAASIAVGHRLAVQIAGSNTPLHNPLQTGSEPQVTVQKLWHDQGQPSRIILPLIDRN